MNSVRRSGPPNVTLAAGSGSGISCGPPDVDPLLRDVGEEDVAASVGGRTLGECEARACLAHVGRSVHEIGDARHLRMHWHRESDSDDGTGYRGGATASRGVAQALGQSRCRHAVEAQPVDGS